MYTIEYYKYSQIESIKEDWEQLYQGKDMTYYQSYDWYLMLRSYSLKDNLLHKNIFALCRNEKGKAILIAPLWILRRSIWWPFNRKGIYLIGREGASDYLSIIYQEFHDDAFDYLLHELCQKYHLHTIKFEQIKEDTALYNYILGKNIIKNHRLISVSLSLPATEDDYQKMLSKSSRQNLRTANNRLLKDGKKLEFVLDDPNVDKKECYRIKKSRLKKKNYEPDKKKVLKNWLLRRLTIKFPDYTPFLTETETHIMSAYCDGKLAAFFNYGVDSLRNNINIMTAGTNEEFARYSPGMLLMYEFIKHTIAHHPEISVIDFTRGDEHYKYALGGENHIIHSIRFVI